MIFVYTEESGIMRKLTTLVSDFPEGVYELEIDGTSYEIVLSPADPYVGSIAVAKSPHSGESKTAEKIGLISVIATVGYPAHIMAISPKTLEIKETITGIVTEIRLLRLLGENDGENSH